MQKEPRFMDPATGQLLTTKQWAKYIIGCITDTHWESAEGFLQRFTPEAQDVIRKEIRWVVKMLVTRRGFVLLPNLSRKTTSASGSASGF